MGKKIRWNDVNQWLLKGKVEDLQQHWHHPAVVEYRAEKLKPTAFTVDGRAWFDGVRNGDTFVFLMRNDAEFCNAHVKLKSYFVWLDKFMGVYSSSWGLLDVAPPPLNTMNGVETLHYLVHEKPAAGFQHSMEQIIRTVRAKLDSEVHPFYRRFQHRGGLTAIAWFDNADVWTDQRPMMANIIQHAARHQPQDVLGAYLVWACEAGCQSTEHDYSDKTLNTVRMKQLRELAERVGLDTSSYEDYAQQCTSIHKGLGLDLDGKNIWAYAQSTAVQSMSLDSGDAMSALFL